MMKNYLLCQHWVALTIPLHITNSAINVWQLILVICMCVCTHICAGIRGCPVGGGDRDNKSVGRMQQPLLSPLSSSCGETTPTVAVSLAREDLALPLLGAEAGWKLTDGNDVDAWCCGILLCCVVYL